MSVVALTVAGAVLSMRIPKWVEVTEGEVPTTLSYHGGDGELRRHPQRSSETGPARQPLGRNIITALWGNCTIKVMVGFLFLYPAFVAKSHDKSGWEQLLILGLIGAAAAIGNFGGNFASARLQLGHPAQLVVRSTIAVTAVALATALTGKLMVAALAALVTSAASAVAKASLDASLQDDLPEESRASAFGRSESLLQLAWVAGGATGVLVYTQLHVGFTVISAVLIIGLAQTLVSYRGDSLIPGLGGNRPVVAAQEGAHERKGFRRHDCGGAAGVKKGLAVLGGRRGGGVCRSPACSIWRLTRNPGTRASGDQRVHARSVGAGRARTEYCNVRDLTECETPRAMGELAVTSRNSVQLSVPEAICAGALGAAAGLRGPRRHRRRGVRAQHHTRGDHSHRRSAPGQAHRHRGGTADLGPRRAG